MSWTFSIVSHGHGNNAIRALNDVSKMFKSGDDLSLILTLNIPENIEALLGCATDQTKAHLTVRSNSKPSSFAQNHNRALIGVQSDYVAMVDPDIQINQDLVQTLETNLNDHSVGFVAPRAYSPEGLPEDNGREAPKPIDVVLRSLRRRSRNHSSWMAPTEGIIRVDWLAGLFLACRSNVFNELKGFDEKYRMYCEDVDLGLRALYLGYSNLLLNDLHIIHPARRQSHSNIKHFLWHVQGFFRLWTSRPFRSLARNV